jgi:hypothetical protein
MRPALVLVLLMGLLGPGGSSAQGSTCSVELRQAGIKKFRMIRCDEDPAAMNDAILRARAACKELPAENQPGCFEAVADSFELRREAMMRRALREGATAEAVADRYGASLAEVERLQAEMPPRESEVDSEAQARAAEELRAVERDLQDWLLQQESR